MRSPSLISQLSTTVLLLLCLVRATTADQPRTKVYAKDKFGVTFRYPADWNLGAPLPSYLSGPDIPVDKPPVAAVFPVSGYPHTDFAGAQFSYSVRRNTSGVACQKLLESVGKTDTAAIGSNVYRHIHADDAAMSHQRSDDLYATSWKGNCLVFELSLLTAGYGATDGIRAMTEAERADINHRLQQILATVKLN